ncbi:subtilisin-like serine protease [Fusarium albosuccineum]|uniref:Subtilisin-like serine protease n=1 Tax=Fusarium albosuccineum TaxID=1237068 RepID=A0A8H4PDF9_9HYPO|nr:subtilisin-like serine protease [Fusarium albosuccineum]
MLTHPGPYSPPFALEAQLTREPNRPARYVPGHPRVPLRFEATQDLLASDLCPDDLDRIADKLWWMTTQNHANISPLHRQLVKRRTIVVTEDPKLHLVWIYDRIFIKPLPKYITSYAFWKDYIYGSEDGKARSNSIRRAALGYLRTYYYLVKHESDFRIAQDPGLCLIPSDITWEHFCNFTSSLVRIQNRHVSPRYSYGEIRLTRLNLYAPLLLGRWHFQKVDYQYGTYFARFYGPFLFVFAFVSVILSGLQVVASVQETGDRGWVTTAVGVSVAAIVTSAGILLTFALVLVSKVVKEWNFAIRERLRLLEENRIPGAGDNQQGNDSLV